MRILDNAQVIVHGILDMSYDSSPRLAIFPFMVYSTSLDFFHCIRFRKKVVFSAKRGSLYSGKRQFVTYG